MAEKTVDPAARFIWQPGDIVLIKRGEDTPDSGKKAEEMPALHKKQLQLDKKSWGNQG